MSQGAENECGGDGGMGDDAGESMLKLTFIVDGERRTWTEDELAEMETLTVPGKKGERDAWSLRTIAAELAGPNAAVTRVIGEEGAATDLAAEQWANEEVLPVLRLNRKVQLKFLWLNLDLSSVDAEQRKGVTEIHVTS